MTLFPLLLFACVQEPSATRAAALAEEPMAATSGSPDDASPERQAEEAADARPQALDDTASPARSEPDWEALRTEMVEEQLVARGVSDRSVLAAMLEVPRHRLVPDRYRLQAYGDHPVPIGEEQTMSQPLIVALMSELARIEEGDKVLEVGTGSGYQAAVLHEMGAKVYSIEIVESLARGAKLTLADLGCDSVEVRHGDGYRGWPEEAPFDAILVTAAPPQVPRPLLEQLKIGGRLVLPVGGGEQELEVYTREPEGFERERHGAVRFVPMTGEAQQEGERD